MPMRYFITRARIEHIEHIMRFEKKNKPFFSQFLPAQTLNRISYEYLIKQLSRVNNESHFLIIGKSNVVIGRVMLTFLSIDKTTAELSYRLDSDFVGQGITTNVIKYLLPFWVCAGLNEITACVSDSNSASKRVLEKSGFQVIERIADGSNINKYVEDVCIYFWRANE